MLQNSKVSVCSLHHQIVSVAWAIEGPKGLRRKHQRVSLCVCPAVILLRRSNIYTTNVKDMNPISIDGLANLQ